jgi:uncharacterized glyoxalase superfamily metalloenzyme YdcJ
LNEQKETKRVDVEPGRALSHDISNRSDQAASDEIDRFIERRALALTPESKAYREEVAWAESTRRNNRAREAELRAEWCEFHQSQAERHRATLEALAAHHEQRAEELSNQPKGAA